MKEKICVLKGGKSPERDISLKSGEAIEEALWKAGYRTLSIDPAEDQRLFSLLKERVDAVFIALHGPGGEDGTIQGWLETLNIPYTGSGVLASALAMDKKSSRKIWKAEGLGQPEYLVIDNEVEFRSEDFSFLRFPFIVKPGRSGSTLGVSLVKEKKELFPALQKAFSYDKKYVLIEEYIQGREVTVGILDDPEPRALPVIEIIPEHEFYDYETKYTQGKSQYIVPAHFAPEDYGKIQNVALKAYKSLGCRDFARVDMIWREGEVYLLEINTIPGMTKISLFPKAARAEGIQFHQLVDKIIQRALRRKRN